MNSTDILQYYGESGQLAALKAALQTDHPKVQLKGLIGAADAMVAVASYLQDERPVLFVLPDHEEASFFLSDLEHLLDRQVLFFPASYRKPFDFTQTDSAHVLQRAEMLNAVNRGGSLPRLMVTYPEALAEKVINRHELEKNTLRIWEGFYKIMIFTGH